jgi:hypothetical protein
MGQGGAKLAAAHTSLTPRGSAHIKIVRQWQEVSALAAKMGFRLATMASALQLLPSAKPTTWTPSASSAPSATSWITLAHLESALKANSVATTSTPNACPVALPLVTSLTQCPAQSTAASLTSWGDARLALNPTSSGTTPASCPTAWCRWRVSAPSATPTT